MKVIVALFLLAWTFPVSAAWLKGNTHTHTLESDGDSTPADMVAWYASRGYDFLVITDHDKITRLATDALVLIPGEEVTDHLPKKPLHVNAIGLRTVVKPQGGATPADVLQRNVNAIREAGGIAAINHPNFGWAFGAEEILAVQGATLLEIASGHPFVNMQGPPAVEEMWDRVLTAGKKIWGIAVDDSHHLKRPWDVDMAPPGKAWIVVRAEEKSSKAILSAITAGDFYASTGVEIAAYEASRSSIKVQVTEKHNAHYRIQFVGSGGRVLQESVGPSATYTPRGDEQYVRARVLDSNGLRAWFQPLFLERARAAKGAAGQPR